MTYLSLTIGPIYETMSYCKKTRELWAGSYFFSYFMKSLIKSLYEYKDEENSDKKIEIIIPYSDEKVLDEYFEVGIFHDRFIAKSNIEKEELKTILEKRIDETIYYMSLFIGDENIHFDIFEKRGEIDKENKLYKALKSYLQYSYIITDEDELLSQTKKENIVFALDAVLDSMELESSFDLENSSKIFKIDRNEYKNPPDGKVNSVAKLQYQAQRLKKEIKQNKLTFKSIPEIALASILEDKIYKDFDYEKFVKDDDIEKYEAFYKEFEKDKDFKPHHKYFAVISADGDGMGSAIRSIYSENPDDITNFSENIYKYISENSDNSKSLVNIFEEYGGMLIYAGGDDLLGFAPIFGKNEKNIFALLEELSNKFQEYLGKKVSLSYGVSLNYYKSPMIEAIKHAHSLLYDAKNNNTEDKSGSLALSLTKHSGQTYEGVFFLSDDRYELYKQLFIDELSEVIKLPHNLQYSLKKYEALFIDIFSNYTLDRSMQKLDALFDNLIKDESHSSEAKTALDRAKEYISIVKPKDSKTYELLLTQLAIIKFLRGDR